MWHLRHILLLLFGIFAISACEDTGPIKIGFLAELSGDGSDSGHESLNALKLAANQINAEGGIKGRKIEIIARDDFKSPNKARTAVKELHDLGVHAIIGPIISSVGMGILPIINQYGIVTISPTVSAIEFTGLNDFLFRINSSTRDNATNYAKFSIENGYKRVAMALDGENEAFTESWYREFLLNFDHMDGEVVSKVWFNSNNTTMEKAAHKLLAQSPDAIIFVANGKDSATLAHEVRKLDQHVKLMAAEWAGTEQLISAGKHDVEGLVILQAYDRYDTNPAYTKFVKSYEEAYGAQPSFVSVLTYDAATVLFAGIKSQHPDQPLANAIQTLPPQQGLNQKLSFDQFGDGKRKAFFVRIEYGQFKLIK